MRIECGNATAHDDDDDDVDDYTTTTTTTTLSTVTIRDGLIEFYYTCRPYTKKIYLQCSRNFQFSPIFFSVQSMRNFFHVFIVEQPFVVPFLCVRTHFYIVHR